MSVEMFDQTDLGTVAAVVVDKTAEKATNAVARFEQRNAAPLQTLSDTQSLLATVSRIAADPNADIEKLTKVMDLYERVRAGQSRQAFDEAIASAKAKIPPIMKNAKGHNDKKYADFAAIARAVDPVLAENGLSYRFRTSQTDRIHVTCVLSHKGGHSEETTLVGPADTSGSKNAIQAIGSTLTYLQRYSLVQALGLAASEDDDGRSSQGGVISEDQVRQLEELLTSTGSDLNRFLAFAKINRLSDIRSDKFDDAVTAIKRAAERRAAHGGQK